MDCRERRFPKGISRNPEVKERKKMKKPLLFSIVILAFLTFTSIGVDAADYRTQIFFRNLALVSNIDEPIRMPDGTAPGSRCVAQLCHVLENGSVQPIGSVGRFYDVEMRSPSYREESRFYLRDTISVVIERYPFPFEGARDALIRLRLRVWEGDSWETARIRGESADFDHILHPLGGGDRPPEVPEMPVNFRGFTLTERPQLGTAGLEANGAIKLTVSTEFALTGTQVRLLKSSDLSRGRMPG